MQNIHTIFCVSLRTSVSSCVRSQEGTSEIKEDVGAPGSGVNGSCELPNMYGKNLTNILFKGSKC